MTKLLADWAHTWCNIQRYIDQLEAENKRLVELAQYQSLRIQELEKALNDASAT